MLRSFAWLAVILPGLFTAVTLPAQTLVSWNGSGTNSANTNWSFSANWTGGTPGTTANLLFTNAGVAATVSNVNNIVDANNTVLSLQYAHTNGYHTTLINSGFTLTVSNNANANLVVVGTLTDNGINQFVDTTITGLGGNLVVIGTNTGSQMQIQQGSTNSGNHAAVLDLSGLGNFSLTAGRLLVAGNAGVATTLPASNYLAGTFYLARTNAIRLNGTATPELNIGDAVSNSSATNNAILLGQTNSLYADAITIGRSKSTGSVKFNPALAGGSPSLYLRGNSTARVTTLSIGDNSIQTSTSAGATGTLDLSLGTVDAQVNTCYLARGQQSATGTGNSLGTLAFAAGTFNVNNLNVGNVSTNNSLCSASGTVNVTGTAVLFINTNLALGSNPNTNPANTACFAKGILSITNGTVYANSITNTSALANGVVGIINVNAGQLTLTNTAGSPALPLGTLALTGASLHLNATTVATNIVTTNVTVSGTSTITLDTILGYTSGTATYPLISYLSGTDPYSGLTYSLPSGYTGTLVDNTAAKRIDLQITAGPITPILGTVIWGGGVSGNWDSTALNWTNGGITTIYADTDTVIFNDTAQTGSVSLVTNVSPGSVTFTNTALAYTLSGPNAIGGAASLIKSGTGSLTLATTNSYAGLTAIYSGTVTLAAPGAIPAASILSFNGTNGINGATLNLGGYAQTVAGIQFTNIGTNTVTLTNGTLTASPAAISFSPFGSSNSLTANFSGLSAFTYSNSAGTFTVANGTVPASGSTGQSTLTLSAKTNAITAGTVNVGTSSDSGGTINSTINLGAVNTLDVGTIAMGSGRAGGTIQFAAGITGGTLAIAGTTGGASTANLVYGSHDSFQVTDHPVDLFDTTAGTLAAQFGSVTIGVANPVTSSSAPTRGDSVTASFKMGAGTLTATSLTVGQIGGSSTNVYTLTNTAVFSITNGGTANITTLTLASNAYTGNLGGSSILSGLAILTNGATLNAAAIQEGGIATPASGTLTVVAQMLWGDGTLGNLGAGNLTVNGISIALAGSANNHFINISAGQTGTINSWISGTGTLTDTGAGAVTLHGNNSFTGGLVMNSTNTLTLAGTNTYTGNTLINAGTLAVSGIGTISTSPLISVAGNAIFNVAGAASPFTLGSGQTLSNNAAATATLNGNLNAGAGTLSASWNSGTPAFTVTNGTLTLSNATTVKVNNTGSTLAPGTYGLIGTNTGGAVVLASQPTVTVTGGGITAGATASLAISGGQLNLVVSPVATTNTLILLTGSNPATYGASLTFQATLSPAPTNGETVTFYDGGTVLGSGPLTGGVATYTTSALMAATHSLTAVYGGESTYAGSTSTVLSQTVNPATLTITALSTNETFVYGIPAFTGGNGVTYAGFVNGETNTVLGGTLAYGGTSQGATNAGVYTIVPSGLTNAVNPNYTIGYVNGALTISQATPVIGLGSSLNPAGFLDSVSFTATLQADATGSVVFSSTNGPISTNTLSGGAAGSASITNLARGVQVITAVYGGDGNYLAGTNTFNQTVTNHPPVTTILVASRTAGFPLEIALTDIATNWTDADGDPVELTAVNLTSTNGASVYPVSMTTNLDGSYVITNTAYLGYVPTADVADQLSYSVSDGQGGTNIGYINIVVVSSVTGTNSITSITGGNPNGLTAYGIPGFTYITERSTNLTDWVEISTNTAATNGVISVSDSFSDLGGSAPSSAFYRLLWQP